MSTTQVDLQARVDELTAQNSALEAKAADAASEASTLRNKLQAERRKVQAAETEAAQNADHLRRQLEVQTQLATLSKKSAASAQERLAEVNKVVSDLRASAASADAANKAAIEKATQEAAQAKADAAKQVEELKKQLLSRPPSAALALTASAGAAASGADASSVAVLERAAQLGGASATELFSRLEKSETELRAANSEKKRLEVCTRVVWRTLRVHPSWLCGWRPLTFLYPSALQAYLSQIMHEIEAKAPLIADLRRDYQRALESHNDLSERLDRARQQCEAAVTEADTAKERVQALTADKASLETQVADLSRQVQLLLKEQLNGTPRGGVAAVSPPRAGGSSATDAHDVISENLVTFKSVQELQVRNQQLLKVLRQLTDDRKADLDAGRAVAQQAAQATLKKALEQVRTMREQREKQEEFVNALVQQRDMYRVLLAQADHKYANKAPAGQPPAGGDASASSAVAAPNTGAVATTAARADAADTASAAALKQLQAEFAQFRAERIQVEREQASALNEAREQTSTTRLRLEQFKADARFHESRCTDLQGMVDASARELERVQEAKTKLQALVVQHQRAMTERESAYTEARDKIAQLQGTVANLRAERDIAQSSVKRMSEEVKRLAQERDRQARLVDHVQRLEAGLEARNEAQRTQLLEDNARLTVRSSRRLHAPLIVANIAAAPVGLVRVCVSVCVCVHVSQNQLEATRKALNDERTLTARQAQGHASAVRDAMRKVEAATNDASEARAELVAARSGWAEAKGRVSVLERQLKALESRIEGKVSALGARDDVERTHTTRLEVRVQQLEGELKAAQEEAAAQAQSVAQYKAINLAHEESLAKLSAASEQWKQEQGTALTASQAKVKALQSSLAKVKEELSTSLKEAAAAKQEWESTTQALRDQVAAAEARVKAVEEAGSLASNREAALQADIKRHDDARKAAQAKYDQQLQLHASDSKALAEKTEECDKLRTAVASLEGQVAQLTTQLVQAKQATTTQRAQLQAQLDAAESTIKDLREQNSLLLSRLETRSFAAAAAATGETSDGSGSGSGSGADANAGPADAETVAALRASSLELQRLVVLKRRELELSECAKEVAERKAARLEAELESVRKSLDDARMELRVAKESARNRETLAAEHSKLMGQVKQLNLLRESNLFLRSDHESALKRAQEAEAKIAELQAAAAPLQAKVRSLEAERDAWNGEREALKREADTWQKKVQRLLETQDQIDPEAHRALQEQVKAAAAEAKAAATRRAALIRNMRGKLNALTEAEQSAKAEVAAKLEVIAAKDKELAAKNEAIAAKDKDATDMSARVAKLRTFCHQERQKSNTASKELAEVKTALATAKAELAKAKAEGGSGSGSGGAATPSTGGGAASAAAVAAANEAKAAADAAVQKASMELTATKAKLTKLSATHKKLTADHAAYKKKANNIFKNWKAKAKEAEAKLLQANKALEAAGLPTVKAAPAAAPAPASAAAAAPATAATAAGTPKSGRAKAIAAARAKQAAQRAAQAKAAANKAAADKAAADKAAADKAAADKAAADKAAADKAAADKAAADKAAADKAAADKAAADKAAADKAAADKAAADKAAADKAVAATAAASAASAPAPAAATAPAAADSPAPRKPVKRPRSGAGTTVAASLNAKRQAVGLSKPKPAPGSTAASAPAPAPTPAPAPAPAPVPASKASPFSATSNPFAPSALGSAPAAAPAAASTSATNAPATTPAATTSSQAAGASSGAPAAPATTAPATSLFGSTTTTTTTGGSSFPIPIPKPSGTTPASPFAPSVLSKGADAAPAAAPVNPFLSAGAPTSGGGSGSGSSSGLVFGRENISLPVPKDAGAGDGAGGAKASIFGVFGSAAASSSPFGSTTTTSTAGTPATPFNPFAALSGAPTSAASDNAGAVPSLFGSAAGSAAGAPAPAPAPAPPAFPFGTSAVPSLPAGSSPFAGFGSAAPTTTTAAPTAAPTAVADSASGTQDEAQLRAILLQRRAKAARGSGCV